MREGKRTVLIALTDLESTDSMRHEIKKYFGDPNLDADGVSIVQEIITSSGARQKLEFMIDQLTEEALRAADNELISEQADSLLRELAKIATKRSS